MSDARIRRLLLVTADFHYRRSGRLCTTSAFMRFVPELLIFAREIEVCAPVHPDGPARGYAVEGPGIRYRPLPPARTLEQFLRCLPRNAIPMLRALYAGTRAADLVWINGVHPLLPLAVVVARLLRTPSLLWLRGDIVGLARSKYGPGHRRRRLALRTAFYLEKLIAASARGGVVFYTGRGLERYAEKARYARQASASLVQQAQLADRPRARLHSPIRLLWAGQMRPVKGLPDLFTAVRALLDGGCEVRLTVVGDGEQRAELEAARERLGLEHAVRFAGYVPPGPELDSHFAEADIYVLPSLSEGVPKVLFEAMARALPVVATRVGGVPGVVRHGENGLLVPPGDAIALATAVRSLLEDGSLRHTLSRGALAYARQHTAAQEARRIHDGLRAAYPRLWSRAR